MNNGLAFVFPGQGAQAVGMMQALGDDFSEIRARYDQASRILGYDLWAIVDHGPEEALNRTACTQPALLTASIAIWDVWRARRGRIPGLVAGHSLGEYSALVCSGALDFEDAVGLVADRGRFMQESVPEGHGAMAAILGLDGDAVRALCVAAADGDTVECANYNAPGQIVIAGHRDAVERVATMARQAGAKRVIPLAVSVPAHCALMRPAAERFASRIAEVPLEAPRIPVIHNVDVSAHADPREIRRVLVEQLASPVRWSNTVEYFLAVGVTTVVECGPGKVLSTLVKRTTSAVTCLPLSSKDRIEAALEQLGG